MRALSAALLVLCGVLIAGAAGAAERCDVPGSGALLKSPATRFILVGETHGTEQSPALFGDLVCALAKSGRKVAVGLEFERALQPSINTFIASDGGPSAIKAMLGAPPWNSSFKDGRTSRAMLALIVRLRSTQRRVEIASVRYIIGDWNAATSEAYERAMGSGISAISDSHPGALVVVLLGSVHGSKHTVAFGGPSYRPAAMWLPPDTEISLFVLHDEGEAWNCGGAAEGCGPHTLVGEHLTRGVHLGVPAPVPGYDGVISSGQASSASPPA